MNSTFASEVQSSPAAHTFFLLGVDFAVGPVFNVVLVGESNEGSMLSLIKPLRKNYLPNMVMTLKSPDKASLGYDMLEGKATVYVCRGQMCLPPTNSVERMLEFLEIAD